MYLDQVFRCKLGESKRKSSQVFSFISRQVRTETLRDDWRGRHFSAIRTGWYESLLHLMPESKRKLGIELWVTKVLSPLHISL